MQNDLVGREVGQGADGSYLTINVLYYIVMLYTVMDEYLTTKEIASLLKVNILTVRRWIIAGKLPATFLGKEYRVSRSDLEKFLSERRVKGRRQK